MDDDDEDEDDDEEELPEASAPKKKSERQLELELGDDYKIGTVATRIQWGSEYRTSLVFQWLKVV